jgi:hypothetical protein
MRANAERMGQAGQDNLSLSVPAGPLFPENGIEPGPGASRISCLTEDRDQALHQARVWTRKNFER